MDYATADGKIRLIRGECLKVLPTIAEKIDAIVSDPPYGIGYWHSGGGRGMHTRRNARMPILGDDRPFDPRPWLAYPCLLWGADHYAVALPRGGTWLAWDKSVGKGPADSFADCEFAWCSRAGIKRNVCRYLWKGIACVKVGEDGGRRCHPSQKPIGLMRWCLELMGLPPGATILDPYMGSGSTGLAALELGYRFIGIESDPAHFATARHRLESALAASPAA